MTNWKQEGIRLDPHFAAVVKAFAKQRSVSRGDTKGLVAGALMVNGRIFCDDLGRANWLELAKEAYEFAKSGRGNRYDQ